MKRAVRASDYILLCSPENEQLALDAAQDIMCDLQEHDGIEVRELLVVKSDDVDSDTLYVVHDADVLMEIVIDRKPKEKKGAKKETITYH